MQFSSIGVNWKNVIFFLSLSRKPQAELNELSVIGEDGMADILQVTVLLPDLSQKLLKDAACAVTTKVGDTHEGVEPTVLPSLCIGEIQHAQRNDPLLVRIWYYIHRGHEPARREKRKEPPAVAKLLQQWDRLNICASRLCRTMMDPMDGSKLTQLSLPSTMKDEVLQE